MFTRIVDIIALFIVRTAIGILNLVPMPFRVTMLSFIIRVFVTFIPSFKKVSFKNLDLVFPQQSLTFKNEVYRRSFDNLARVIVDFARLHTLDEQWVQRNVQCAFLPRFQEMKKNNPEKGVLIVTGHLGSFELMAHSIAVLGYPISFVVRNAKLPLLDSWWSSTREKNGNQVINRNGAVKKIITNLSAGKDAALLFDQNVKRNHAVFVEWFGRLAATTMTVGLAAVRCRAHVVVCSMRYGHNDHYTIEAVECPCEDIYDSETMSLDEKIKAVTMRASALFEKMIQDYPEGWFWMHRRWKTTPEGERELFYQ